MQIPGLLGEEKEGGGGAKLLQAPRWGHPEARVAELLARPKLLAGRSGFGGLTRKRQNLNTREALCAASALSAASRLAFRPLPYPSPAPFSLRDDPAPAPSPAMAGL